MKPTKLMTLRKELLKTLADNNIPSIKLTFSLNTPIEELPQLGNSMAAYTYLMGTWDCGTLYLQEEFKILLLNNDNRVLGPIPLSKGSHNRVIVPVNIIIGAAILSTANKLIIAHNHPSGGAKPSNSDGRITGKIERACANYDLQLVDHIILAGTDYFSFSDNGLLSSGSNSYLVN